MLLVMLHKRRRGRRRYAKAEKNTPMVVSNRFDLWLALFGGYNRRSFSRLSRYTGIVGYPMKQTFLMRNGLLRRSVLFIALGCVAAGGALAESQPEAALDRETLLLASLGDLRQNQMNGAVEKLKALVDQQPDFRLAQLIYADLLAAQGAPLSVVGNNGNGDKKVLEGLISEARARMSLEGRKPVAGMIPSSLLKMSADQEHVIVVDIQYSRLFLFENQNGVPVLIKDYYVSYGRGGINKRIRGDLRTPLGVYFTTGRLDDEQLPPRYGTGALPINYPNAWDVRQGNTGSGIWLHGSPKDTFSRPPKASEGCISLTNGHFTELDGIVDFNATPVLIGASFDWIDQASWEKKQQSFTQLVEGWRADWQSLNADSYLAHYSPSFNNGEQDYARFSAHKRRVNGSKSFINVELEDLSIYQYPDNPDLFVATFVQKYSSDNYSGSDVKRQYWVKENEQWKIAYEGAPQRGIP